MEREFERALDVALPVTFHACMLTYTHIQASSGQYLEVGDFEMRALAHHFHLHTLELIENHCSLARVHCAVKGKYEGDDGKEGDEDIVGRVAKSEKTLRCG